MFEKLRRRLTLVCTAVTGLVLLVMALASLHFSVQQLSQRADEAFQGNLNAIFFYLRGQTAIDHTWLSQTEAAGGLLIRVEDNGRPFLYTYQDPQREALTSLAQQQALALYGFDCTKPPSTSLMPDKVLFTLDTGGVRYHAAVCTVPVAKGWLGVTVLKSATQEQLQIQNLCWIFAGFTAAAILCLGLFAWVFTARAIRPVEENRRRQDEFVSAASHELRSPLAVMQASAGAIQSAPLEEARRFARTIESECTRLSRLTGDLLTLAGADIHRWTIETAPVEPETLLLSVSERFEPVARQHGLSITAMLPDEPLPRCRWDASRIEQVLSILIDNAVSYTPSGGKIQLAAVRCGRAVCLTVTDNGPGIPDEQKARVFERFYRADASRSKREHYGLGLSIAKEIAHLHKGSLILEDAPGGGARFVLTLPQRIL
ncbi:sensor histidine kinase [Anaerotruncus sp. AF02-27]|uniref:sensor histidine kinase n=3 Tax=Oscillospiraceae TaxID=216572 RepID=UPI000E53E0BF|nr:MULTISPECIES: HAMP domain-containing sensor histidine kinase [Anaerotruncus]RGX54546.1 sensor histidine kinase [Anaerotruncus sp. AF02-27]